MLKRTIKYIDILRENFLNIIYYKEEKCILCNKELFNDSYICKNCKNKIKLCNENLCFSINHKDIIVYSSLYYSSTIKEIILKLKYRNDFRCGDMLAKYMIEVIKNKHIEFDLITYIPSSLKNKREYNQSKYLARCIGKFYNKKVIDVLEKSKNTKDQIGLNYEERWENLKNSFIFNGSYNIKDKKILLVDDVITTGATAYYCSLELIKNLSREIIVLTAAKSSI